MNFLFLVKRIGIISGLAVLLFLNSCSGSSDCKKELVGKWQRTDGNYQIEISNVQDEGVMVAKYYNPNPINVGKAKWELRDEKLNVYVELRDKNYPGSTYMLTYDEEKDILIGNYFQAVSSQTFDVVFARIEK